MTSIDTEHSPGQDHHSPAGLTDDEMAMLDLERSWWKHAGAKETQIRERFDVSSTIYYARLNRLIDRPEALAADPMLVRRLLRLRDARRRQRTASQRLSIGDRPL